MSELLNELKLEEHYDDPSFCFLRVNIDDHTSFYNDLADYVFSESKLLSYVENISSIKFNPSKEAYTKLYKELDKFIDDENIESLTFDKKGFAKETIETLIEEYDGGETATDFIIRLDKIGRIGEYIFHHFLVDHFSLSCILPKISMTTNKNMSIYGIDLLFYDEKESMILFGESKVTVRLNNGITQVNISLSEYEKQIREEFKLVFGNNQLKIKALNEIFQDAIEVSISFDEFVNNAGITKIGIPVFITHGEDVDPDTIINDMNSKIVRKELFGIDTKYILISMPIIDKHEFTKHVTQHIKSKMTSYAASR